MRQALRIVVLAVLCSGCLPRTTIHRNPGKLDHGVRFYRPKPYLLIKQAVDTSGNEKPGFVTLEMVTMPDFSEEYSIHVSSGLGTNNTSITLDDGWKLSKLDVDIDSQFDENVKAISDLVGSVGGLGGRGAQLNGGAPSLMVRACNVPLGLYESVLSRGPDGVKRLFGFRYIGFFPYNPCPIESCGVMEQGCLDGDVYGLVFEDGVMVFRPLASLPDHHFVETKAVRAAGARAAVGELAPSRSTSPGIDSDETFDEE